jgi:chorismate mutase/prephenate dehydratase
MINELRKEVDKLDTELISLLAKRMDLSRQIGNEKKESGEDIHVRTREITVLDQVKLLGDRAGLADAFVTNLYQVVLAESRRIQESD